MPRPARLHRIALLPCLTTLAALLLCAPLCAHGGTYRGPGGGLGPAGAPGSGPAGPGTGPGAGGPSAGGGPTTGQDAAGDLTAWQMWWGFNREPYLELRRVLAQGSAVSTAGARVHDRAGDDEMRRSVVPALLRVLEVERNPDIVTAALLAVAKIGPRLDRDLARRASQQIQDRLSDANQEVAETAALALGILALPDDLPLLADLMADGPLARERRGRDSVPTRSRAFAAYALGVSGSRHENPDLRRWIVHHLARGIEQPVGASRDVHVACLIAMGLVPLPNAGAALAGDGPAPAASSLEAQVDFLAEWYADARNEALVRAYAPVSLARLAGGVDDERREAVVRLLSKPLESGSPEPAPVRQAAISALGLVADGGGGAHDQRARALLKLAGTEGDRLGRRLAWIALARASARPGRGGADALGESRAHLVGLLSRGSTPERPWLSLALGVGERAAIESGQPRSRGVQTALEAALRQHTSPAEAGAHTLALALAGADSAPVLLLERLAELRDDDARAHCAVALGIARVGQAVDPLREIVLGSRYKPRLLRETAIGLGLLGDQSLTPVLVDMLRSARGQSALASTATALGWVGDQRAVAPLLAIAGDTGIDAGARAFAIVALGLLGDPAPLPWNTAIALDTGWWLPPATLYEPATSTGVLDLL